MVSATPARSGARGVSAGWGWVWVSGLALGLLGLGPWLLRPEGLASPPAPPARMEAPVPVPLPAPQAAPRGAETASASVATPVTAAVRILALRQDSRGRWLARLQVGDDAPRLVQAGDVVAHGLRVEQITGEGLTLRRGLLQEQLAFAGAVPRRPIDPQSPPAPAPAVIVSPPGQEPPRSSGVERAVQRALQGPHGQAGLGSGR